METYSGPPKTGGYTAKILIYFCAVLVLFAGIALLTNENAEYISDTDALEGFDFSSKIAYISPECFVFYPNALYAPESFPAEDELPPPESKGGGAAKYGTYRLTLKLAPGKVYGLSGYSATYAQTLWVNGELLSEVGTTGESAEAMTPATKYFSVYFKAESEQTEIIIQRSDFVHGGGGQLFPLYLGEQSLVSAMNAGALMSSSITVGCMLMAALFFFGIFLFFETRSYFLLFSLSCVMIIIRTLSVDHKLIMILFPDMSWYLAHKLEYLATITFFFLFFLYINRMYGQKLKHPINVYGIIITCTSFLLVLLSPSDIYTKSLHVLQAAVMIYALVFCYLLGRRIVRRRTLRRTEHFLIFAGVTAYVLLSIPEIILHSIGGRYDDLNLTQIGIMAFMLANTLALVLSFTRTEAALDEATRREQEMDETNRFLERLDKLRSDFLSNISHEIKTPLTVISGYAQRAYILSDSKAVLSEDTRNGLLTISMEAQRLAMLAEQLLDTSAEATNSSGFGWVDPVKLLDRASALCAPILEKNGNKLRVFLEPQCPLVHAREDMILQVLVNLCVNANRHTRDGEVVFAVRQVGDMAEFTVEDKGDGISPELLRKAFERGVSGDGGNGLGLTICKDVIGTHGGEIKIESEENVGTRVIFTLPIENRGEAAET